MLHNMLVPGVTPLGNTNELQNWENRPFISSWPEDEKSKDTKRPIKKKAKRLRTAYTTEQIKVLERTFVKTRYIDSDRRKELAKSLNIGEKCIKVWFQNRRMKEKKESSESSCDSSSEVITSGQSTSSMGTSNEEIQYEPPQYEIHPTPYYTIPNWYASNGAYNSMGLYPNMPMSNAPSSLFYNDNNVYPTQYYPSLGMEYSNNYASNTTGQFGQYHGEMYGNWPNLNPSDTYHFT